MFTDKIFTIKQYLFIIIFRIEVEYEATVCQFTKFCFVFTHDYFCFLLVISDFSNIIRKHTQKRIFGYRSWIRQFNEVNKESNNFNWIRKWRIR